MNTLFVYSSPNSAKIEQLNVKRDWMDQTYDRHAYNCFPINITNSLGWGLSFPEDITFIWDGISDSSSDHVKILSGEKWCNSSRANATISFNTGLNFKTDDDITTLIMPVPNQFIDGVQCFTALISTSFFFSSLPVVWKITRPNVPITIKAGTPVCSIIPVSLSNLNNSEIILKDFKDMPRINFNGDDYSKKAKEMSQAGSWTHFYRNATDHLGNNIGKHEVNTLKLKVVKEDKTK